MPEVTIVLKITVPEGATVEVITEQASVSHPAAATSAPDDGIAWMEHHAPAPQQSVQRRLLDELRQKFGLVGAPPSTGNRPYLNFVPSPRFRSSRVAALTLNTGRFYAVLDPALAAEFPGSVPAEGRYLTCYLKHESDVDLAVALTRKALQVRGWEDVR